MNDSHIVKNSGRTAPGLVSSLFMNVAKGCHCQAPALHGNKMAAGIPSSHADTISRGKREGYLLLVCLSKSKQTFFPKLLHNHSHFSLTRILGDNHEISCCPNFDGCFHKPKFYRQSTPMGCCLVGVILGRPITIPPFPAASPSRADYHGHGGVMATHPCGYGLACLLTRQSLVCTDVCTAKASQTLEG